MNGKPLLCLLALLQAFLGLRVFARLLRTMGGERIEAAQEDDEGEADSLAIIVPVLNEARRLAPCLEGLLAQGPEVGEIVVVDGGSTDGTQALVTEYVRREPRLRLLDASPVPPAWNGKTWGLQMGLRSLSPAFSLVLTIDADVRPAPLLARSLLVQMRKTGVAVLSVATLQEVADTGSGLLHPALLTTLVYRFGMPGQRTRRVREVQANGQCFLFKRAILEQCGGFALARDSLCEDVTLARALARAGYEVGFYEAGELVSVSMYENWREMWENWPRSLSLRDRFSGGQTLLGWLEIALVQALPLPLFLALVLARAPYRWLTLMNGVGLALRIGTLFGTARVYRARPWSYWFSPFCDLPVAGKLGINALRRHYTWRGRSIVRGGVK
jgi:dolichol-phosphate mannosyltransferase